MTKFCDLAASHDALDTLLQGAADAETVMKRWEPRPSKLGLTERQCKAQEARLPE